MILFNFILNSDSFQEEFRKNRKSMVATMLKSPDDDFKEELAKSAEAQDEDEPEGESLDATAVADQDAITKGIDDQTHLGHRREAQRLLETTYGGPTSMPENMCKDLMMEVLMFPPPYECILLLNIIY